MTETIISIACNIALMGLCLFLLLRLPKRNTIIGYRMRKAMVSEEAWERANKKFCWTLLITCGINIIIIVLLSIIISNEILSIVVGIYYIVIIAEIVLLIMSTQRYLGKKFKDTNKEDEQ
ncbi:MAG: SdpI family protein [Peptococcaceae bacterium]|nr:SdpI family protein [Peptococcaceae bacterium]